MSNFEEDSVADNNLIPYDELGTENEASEDLRESEKAANKRERTSSRKRGKPPRPPKTEENDAYSSLGIRKNRSPAWDHFERTDDPDKAKCIYCAKLIGCSSKNGTTCLTNHIQKSCLKSPARLDLKQKKLDLHVKTIVNSDGTSETMTIPTLWQFDQEICRKALTKMLIMDEIPFRFVEREGFRFFVKTLCPQFAIPSRNTISRDCYKLFIEERDKLKNFFVKLSSKVCLTTDTWTSGQNMSYMCLTAHFIDDNWNLHKKIINFCPIAGHSGKLIGRAVEKCLNEWGLKNILTLTVDNASANKKAIDHLEMVVKHWGCGVLGGKYLHVRCASHILNLVVKDGLKEVEEAIPKIRALVRYVRSSPARLQKFKECIEEEKIESKSLVCLDVETRWNSTYLMLESALKFRKAFDNLWLKDSSLRSQMEKIGGCPSMSDWIKITSFLPFLKIFYDATLKLSGSHYVTSNRYMDDIFGVGIVISAQCNNSDMGCAGSGDKSELERYLEHALEPRESHFNVLHWWKTNQKRYPTLALIARDLLAIPVSTVASECAFSTGGRVLDSFRTSLTPRMVESLICTQDWLRTSRTPLVLEENILQLEELEEGMFDLLKEQPSIIIDETLDPSDLFDMDFED